MMYHGCMAVITSKQEVCDECRNSRRKVAAYRVGQDGHLVRVLLCREHAAPVEHLIALGSYVPSESPRVRVWGMDEIEAEKAKAKAKARSQGPGNKKTAP